MGILYLPDSNHCIGYEYHDDDNRLYKGRGGFFPFLKPGQDLQKEEKWT